MKQNHIVATLLPVEAPFEGDSMGVFATSCTQAQPEYAPLPCASNGPLPDDLVIRRRDDEAVVRREVFVITHWPDANTIVAGSHQSHGYALRQAQIMLKDRSARSGTISPRPGVRNSSNRPGGTDRPESRAQASNEPEDADKIFRMRHVSTSIAVLVVAACGVVVWGQAPAKKAAAPTPSQAAQKLTYPPIPNPGFAPGRPLDQTRAVYQFAAEHPEVLKFVPCYCGCESSGHPHNESCFVKRRDATGGVVEWDPHGYG